MFANPYVRIAVGVGGVSIASALGWLGFTKVKARYMAKKIKEANSNSKTTPTTASVEVLELSEVESILSEVADPHALVGDMSLREYVDKRIDEISKDYTNEDAYNEGIFYTFYRASILNSLKLAKEAGYDLGKSFDQPLKEAHVLLVNACISFN